MKLAVRHRAGVIWIRVSRIICYLAVSLPDRLETFVERVRSSVVL